MIACTMSNLGILNILFKIGNSPRIGDLVFIRDWDRIATYKSVHFYCCVLQLQHVNFVSTIVDHLVCLVVTFMMGRKRKCPGCKTILSNHSFGPASNLKNRIFLLDQISPSASPTREIWERD